MAPLRLTSDVSCTGCLCHLTNLYICICHHTMSVTNACKRYRPTSGSVIPLHTRMPGLLMTGHEKHSIWKRRGTVRHSRRQLRYEAEARRRTRRDCSPECRAGPRIVRISECAYTEVVREEVEGRRIPEVCELYCITPAPLQLQRFVYMLGRCCLVRLLVVCFGRAMYLSYPLLPQLAALALSLRFVRITPSRGFGAVLLEGGAPEYDQFVTPGAQVLNSGI